MVCSGTAYLTLKIFSYLNKSGKGVLQLEMQGRGKKNSSFPGKKQNFGGNKLKGKTEYSELYRFSH
jgi:hypothetical protein